MFIRNLKLFIQNLHTDAYSGCIIVAKTWEQPCPPIGEWTSKLEETKQKPPTGSLNSKIWKIKKKIN